MKSQKMPKINFAEEIGASGSGNLVQMFCRWEYGPENEHTKRWLCSAPLYLRYWKSPITERRMAALG